jgi:hypothetical protein
MNLQGIVDAMNKSSKESSAKEYNLGIFIKELKELDKEKEIILEEGVYPECLDSWRGSYCELALEYGDKKISVGELLDKAKKALDSTMTGYKGGDFVMDEKTPIHIANYGECGFRIKKYEYNLYYDELEKEAYPVHASVKLIGIEDKGAFYKLKLRIDEEYEIVKLLTTKKNNETNSTNSHSM